MAKLIKTDGTVTTVTPVNGSDFKAEEIHNLIGGHFEMIPLDNNACMLVDDNGKISGKEYNFDATQVAKERATDPFSDYVAGDALVCEEGEVH